MTSAYLEIIIGPMFSGKTSKLLSIYKKEKYCNKEVLVINYTHDKRYSDTKLSTHDKIMIPCTQATNLNSLFNIVTKEDTCNLLKHSVILINEGQFFEDLYDWVSFVLENYNIHIYVCGLDGDYKRKKFGDILNLIPLCDNVTKLSALCSICKNGNLGIFSHRVTDEKKQLVIGNDNYMPLCRNCYKIYNKSI